MTRIKYVMDRELREQQFVTPSEVEQASATLRQACAGQVWQNGTWPCTARIRSLIS